MNRSPHIRGLIALAAVGLSLYVALTVPVHLGLDLRGGTQIVLETKQPEREHEVHPDARGEAPKSSLASPALVQYRIHQLGRDDLC